MSPVSYHRHDLLFLSFSQNSTIGFNNTDLGVTAVDGLFFDAALTCNKYNKRKKPVLN